MPRTPPEDLQTFLQRQDAPTLVAVLLEPAEDHDAVKARLTRLQLTDRPDKLAAGFRKTLNGWRRSKRFMVGGEAREFGALCAFLCSVHAGYFTGQNLLIDGGAYPGTF
jgi:NAD(P)-dependent dehydrogenase (short-subunit alcohol dehydrogenase family)